MVKTVSAKSSGVRKAATELPAKMSFHPAVDAVPALSPTAKDGWAYPKSKKGETLTAAAKKAAWDLLQDEYIMKDALLLAAGLKAHAEHRINYAKFICNHSGLWTIVPQSVKNLVGAYCTIDSALSDLDDRHEASVEATTRYAKVLWSKREGNKVPIQFAPLAKKPIFKNYMEKIPVVTKVPPPPEDEVEPARFKADKEKSQRNSEETYLAHMAAMKKG
jgi:hypothetical protein